MMDLKNIEACLLWLPRKNPLIHQFPTPKF